MTGGKDLSEHQPPIGANPVDDAVLVKVRDPLEGQGGLQLTRHLHKMEGTTLKVIPLLGHLRNNNRQCEQ